MSSHISLKDEPENLVIIANDLYHEAKTHVEKLHKMNLVSKVLVLSNLTEMHKIIIKLSKPQEDLQTRYDILRAENAALEKQVKAYEMKLEKIQEEFELNFNTPPLPPDWINSMVIRLEEHANAVAELRKQTQELIENLTQQNQAQEPNAVAGGHKIYSVLVSSELADVTGDQLIETIRRAVDAKNTGIKLDKLRKVKNDSVVVGCKSEEIMTKVKERILAADHSVVIEEIKGKDPMVILRNVMTYYSDNDITDAFMSQNRDIFGDLPAIDFKYCVKYRKNTKDQDQQHVIMQVSPKVWQRLTKAGVIQIDVQCVTVEDYSPLIQCTKCLAYGHRKSQCIALELYCSHCGGPHTRASCLKWMMGKSPSCRNCLHALLFKTEHNAFDYNCPMRKTCDTAARSSVAYE